MNKIEHHIVFVIILDLRDFKFLGVIDISRIFRLFIKTSHITGLVIGLDYWFGLLSLDLHP